MKINITESNIEEVLLNEFNIQKSEIEKRINQFDEIEWIRLVLVISVNFNVSISDTNADLLINNIKSNKNNFVNYIKDTVTKANLLTDLEKNLHLDWLNQTRALDDKVAKGSSDIGLFRIHKSKLN